MHRKLLTTVVLICCFSSFSFSQGLMHSFGANFSYLTGKVKDQYSSSNFSLVQTNLSYFPRFNVVEMENSSLSVGVPLGLGLGIAKSVNGDDAGIGFAYDLPIVLDYNVGCKSSYDNEGTFGGYFGVGFGYSHVSISESSYMDFKGTTYGPMVRAGIRIGSDSESWEDHAITIGFSFKKGLEKEKLSTFGLSVLLDVKQEDSFIFYDVSNHDKVCKLKRAI